MPTDIPEDVLELAREHSARWANGSEGSARMIAAALIADRAAQAERMARLEEATIEQIMREEWDEICRDTGCHPLDITREGRMLFFHPSHWATAIAKRLAARALSQEGSDA